MTNNFKVVSFNCNGVKAKMPVINSLCQHCDIIFLQETWLREDELEFLNNVNRNFESFSLTSMNIHDSILIGRPFGGISILWNRSLSRHCRVIHYEDSRLLGISLTFHDQNFLFLNVYLPYFSNDNLNDYDMYIGKITSIVDNTDADGVAIIGDFNASQSNPFLENWRLYVIRVSCLCLILPYYHKELSLILIMAQCQNRGWIIAFVLKICMIE